MRGRRVKVYVQGEEPIMTTILLSKKLRDLIQSSGINMSKEVSEYFFAKFAGGENIELSELKKKKEKLERELLIINEKISEIETKTNDIKKIEELKEQNKKFIGYLVRKYVKMGEKNLNLSVLYNIGIDIDTIKLGEDYRKGVKISQMTDEEIIERYKAQVSLCKSGWDDFRKQLFNEFLEKKEGEQKK
ncbi:MAG: hypothetical protein QXV17_13985 [Candidatus Micrarchaeaceae archaeon]